MIIRDSAESVKGNAQDARQRLGQLIEHYMNERGYDDRRVARTCSCSAADVESWRLGKVVPSSDQWSKLKRSVHHAIGHYNEVYQRARKEAEDEARARAQASMNKPTEQPKEPMRPNTKINTALADKLPAISIVRDPDPEPARPQVEADTLRRSKTTRTAMAKLPKGWKSHEMLAKRRAFALDILRQRPNIRDGGADGLEELLLRAFGVGLASYTVKELREQARREAAERPQPIASPPPMQWQPPIPTMLNVPALAKPLDDNSVQERIRAESAAAHAGKLVAAAAVPNRDHAGDIETAVQLILEALPQLQTFTITVDEHGEASVDYQIRKVVITTDGGSFKVKR